MTSLRSGHFEAALAALLWAALVVGSAVLALTLPVYTSAMTQALDVPGTSGLPPADVVQLSDNVRALVADREYDPLPGSWKGQPAFDGAAVSHLLDVRAVIGGAKAAVVTITLVLAFYVWWCVRRRRHEQLARGLRWGAWGAGVATAVAIVVAVTSFDALFTAFHSLFFADGTWVFPYDSLLIRLFPERFWMASGAMWGGLVFVGALVLGLSARLLRGKLVRGNASRSANYV